MLMMRSSSFPVKSVQNKTVPAQWLSQFIPYHADHHTVGYELAGIHTFLCFKSQRRLIPDRLAQQITGGDFRPTKPSSHAISLSSLSNTWSTEKHESHHIPLAGSPPQLALLEKAVVIPIQEV